MSALLTIEFEDGSVVHMELEPKVLVSNHPGKQAIEIRETKNGKWSLYFTERTMQGKKFKAITVVKE